MDMPSLVRNLRIYARSEITTAEALLRVHLRKAGLSAIAIALAMFGLVLINMAFYALLQPVWGPVWTPLALGMFNFLLAGMFGLAVLLIQPGPELALADELRRASAAAIEDDLKNGAGAVGQIGGQLVGAGAAQLLVPTIGAIIGALTKKKAA
jgi:hypothetical protein